MNNEEIRKVIDWVIVDLQRMSYELEPNNVKKSNILFDNVVSTLKHDVNQLAAIKSCLKAQEETKMTNTDVSNSIIKDTIEKLESIMPGMSHMPLNRSIIDTCISNLKTVQFYFDENIQSKKVEYVRTKINLEDISIPDPVVLDPKAHDYIYCMFLSDYYKKKCEFIEAIERYGYECGKQDELEKAEWFTKILGYHSELVDILMRGILKEKEYDNKA